MAYFALLQLQVLNWTLFLKLLASTSLINWLTSRYNLQLHSGLTAVYVIWALFSSLSSLVFLMYVVTLWTLWKHEWTELSWVMHLPCPLPRTINAWTYFQPFKRHPELKDIRSKRQRQLCAGFWGYRCPPRKFLSGPVRTKVSRNSWDPQRHVRNGTSPRDGSAFFPPRAR